MGNLELIITSSDQKKKKNTNCVMIMKVNEEMKKQGSEKEVVSLAKNADHVPFQQVPGQ